MLTERSTLTQYLIEERRRHPGSSGELNSLVLDVALACKAISKRIASGTLTGVLGSAGAVDGQGELLATEIFRRTNEWGGQLAGLASAEPHTIPAEFPRGKYLLVFEPLDGSPNLDVNVSAGSIFSILRAREPGDDARVEDFLQPGTEQVAAGYALYGPSTVLVLTVGAGVQAFTLDPDLGEFFLTRRGVEVPEGTSEYAVNTAHRRSWDAAVKRYIDEALQGSGGPREKDFTMRWVASLVAEAHRILTRGGVFMYTPGDAVIEEAGRLRLLRAANPIGFLIEQAGGLATTGVERLLEVEPEGLDECVGFVFGSREEVERIIRYHSEPTEDTNEPTWNWNPLYGARGLFHPV
ncbi:class 1 fructose-bisphosphatase [Saccharopolyspora rhizosphaerae]|uniref:Fructose-1,6-bisphosphatase class 1 n=1 Tax=Saccharopolyspora rhizosphaerae TaxID=2492662 RepID=A0A3R8QB03_9PSEU|nr:class 1 fructose-bisphosphatase [Saccharopolyspora rhizosphaerae]RRO16959.1 class 1 fructose-bisphosphatase [Saccharopolyspora rhizosphaerae]